MRQNIFLELIFTAIFSLILTVALTYPTALNLTTSFIGDGGDNYEHAGYQSLFAKQLKVGNYPFSYTTFWRYPIGFDFSRGFDSYISVITGGFLSLIFGMPISYNLTLYLLLIANGVCSYLFFRFLVNSRLLGVAGMIMYGFSFYALAKMGSHPNLLFIGSIPLFALSILNLVKKTHISFKDMLFPFLALLIASLGSVQYFIILLTFTAIYILILYLLRSSYYFLLKEKLMRDKLLFTFALLSFLVMFIIFYAPYLSSIFNKTFTIPDREGILFALTPSITDFFLPNKYITIIPSLLGKSISLPSIEKVVFVGWIELILFILFFTSKAAKSTKQLIFIAFLIPFILSLGFGKDNNFFLLPYRFLSHTFPFKIIAEPGRYFIVFYLFMTISVVLFLNSIEGRKKQILITLAVLATITLERFPLSFHMTSTLANDSYVQIVKREDSEAVLDLPVNPFYAPYDVLSFYYNKPIVNGYFHWSANTKDSLSFATNDLLKRYVCSEKEKVVTDKFNYLKEDKQDRELIEVLKGNGIQTIVIHKDDKFFHSVCKNVRVRLSRLAPFITTATPSAQKQIQINAEAWDGKPSFSLYFPQDGTVYLDGAYIAPQDSASFFITFNGGPLDFQYGWNFLKDGKSMELSPKYTIKTDVKAGTLLTFQSYYDVSHTWFSLWYRYLPDEDSSTIPYSPKLEKIYEDKKAIIYRIHDSL